MPPGDNPTGERRPYELAVVMLVVGIDIVEMYELDRDVDTEGMVAPRARVDRRVGDPRELKSRRRGNSVVMARSWSLGSFGLAALRF
jgi:hypothetical protein